MVWRTRDFPRRSMSSIFKARDTCWPSSRELTWAMMSSPEGRSVISSALAKLTKNIEMTATSDATEPADASADALAANPAISFLGNRNAGFRTFPMAGRIVMLAVKLAVTATATSMPNLINGGTSLLASTRNPSASAAKLKNSARPVDGKRSARRSS